MDSTHVITILRRHEADLRARGVRHAALFGSIARGMAGPDSDIDIMVDLDPEIVRTIYDYVGVKDFVTELFPSTVDVVNRETLKPLIRPTATAEAIYAF